MKLSFSRPSGPSSTQQTTLKTSNIFNTEDQDPSKPTIKEYVTEFVASITPTDAQKSKNLVAVAQKSKNPAFPPPPNEHIPHKKMTKLVIPPLPNEFRPHKKMKNLDLPLRPSDLPDIRFEVEKSSSVADGDPHISYGINLRNSSASIPNTDTKKFESDESPPLPPPPQRAAAVETVLLQKLKEDLNTLNDCGVVMILMQGVDEYDGMTVEEFGAALLSGYGWHEGRGIGRDAKGDVKVINYKRRTGKRGIGFSSEMLSNIMFSEKKEEEQSSSRGEDKELGLGLSVDEVKVSIGHVAELGSIEEERCLRKSKESKDEMGSDGWSKHSHRGSKRERIGDQRNRVAKQSRKTESRRTTTQLPWLTSHIRVRIISKEFKGGRLYLKKGEVVDMVGQTSCDISMDGSREVIQGVDQDILETVIPDCGGAVLVLYGKHKGSYGHLLERDMDNETCIVRDADSHELLKHQLVDHTGLLDGD